MLYPTIKQYIDALGLAEDNFDQLASFRLVTGVDGNPVMSSGNFAIVFKMQDSRDGSFHAVKCFLKDQPGRTEAYHLIADELEQVTSSYLARILFLERELFVDTGNGGAEYPVLVMDWVEGITLDRYLRQHLSDPYALGMLAYHFARLGAWLLTQPFAHGDLKPDNILVRPDGTLVLVDYDGMYVPAMQGQRALEAGTPDFRHPLRTDADFNEHIDDFPLASILLSLRAVAYCPDYFDRYGATDRLLLSEADYRSPEKSAFLRDEFPSPDAELNRVYALFLLALSDGSLAQISFRLFALTKLLSGGQQPNPPIDTKTAKHKLPEGALPGLFSINANGDKVCFAQGNLQYQSTTRTWRFAEHQWDYVGDANSNIGAAYSGWIDLFGWGTGNNPTLASENESDYGIFVDWGKNAIAGGGSPAILWRTLTIDEWEYLLNKRANASTKKASGNVGGVHGLILLPDSWTLPSGCKFNACFASDREDWTHNSYTTNNLQILQDLLQNMEPEMEDWTHNSYTLAQWAKMEAAGAVFLPAAGNRLGKGVYGVGSYGFCWSSTPNTEFDAYYVNLGSDYSGTINDLRCTGQSVRLILDNN